MRCQDDATLITSMVAAQINLFSSTPSNLAEMIERAPGKNFGLKFEQTNMENGKPNEIYKKHHGRDLPPKSTGK